MGNVTFFNADVSLRLPGKKKLKAFIISIFVTEGKQVKQLDYVFCSDEFLVKLNKDYLSHDTLTDIITFDLSSAGEQAVVGEIYISIDRVRDNAKDHGTTFQNELCRVLFHGALHLCGYKDKRKSEITEMREKEDYFLRLFDEN